MSAVKDTFKDEIEWAESKASGFHLLAKKVESKDFRLSRKYNLIGNAYADLAVYLCERTDVMIQKRPY